MMELGLTDKRSDLQVPVSAPPLRSPAMAGCTPGRGTLRLRGPMHRVLATALLATACALSQLVAAAAQRQQQSPATPAAPLVFEAEPATGWAGVVAALRQANRASPSGGSPARLRVVQLGGGEFIVTTSQVPMRITTPLAIRGQGSNRTVVRCSESSAEVGSLLELVGAGSWTLEGLSFVGCRRTAAFFDLQQPQVG